MTRYFVTYFPYTNDISRVYCLVGETKNYYKIKPAREDNNKVELLNKGSMYLRGSDIKLYELTEEEIVRKITRQKNILFCERTKWKELKDSQLERIRKILEEE